MSYTNPTKTAFKNYFVRDFPFGDDINENVLDADIEKAFGQTDLLINQALFTTQANYTIGYMHLAAHFLVIDLTMSSQGINGQYSFLENSKSVGSVSQSFSIPQYILDQPQFAMLAKTNYGAKFIQLILPYMSGAIYSVQGTTRP